jgi:pyridoxal phosphate-dependent aminotransferase EpsN
MLMRDRIWLSPPHMSGREVVYVQEAFDSNWIAPAGPHITAFEEELAQFNNSNHVAALSSGTAALHLALILLNIGKGDIVLCQSLTFVASANPILYQGATPVFIDSETDTWNICPNVLEDALKFYHKVGKKPKAVIGVHLYGMPCMLDEILHLCEKYDVPFIEDAAEALGSMYKNKHAGGFGKIGIFSFNGNKIITTSGGGALVSKDCTLISRAKFLAAQAKDEAPYYAHSEMGYNYRMSNICAGIGRAQLEVLEERVDQRRNNYNFYKHKLSALPGISFQPEPVDIFSNRWLTAIRVDPKLSGTDREKIRLHLESCNIESRPVWKPMHLQLLFKDAPYFGGSIGELLFNEGLCLPSGSSLISTDRYKIAAEIETVLV